MPDAAIVCCGLTCGCITRFIKTVSCSYCTRAPEAFTSAEESWMWPCEKMLEDQPLSAAMAKCGAAIHIVGFKSQHCVVGSSDFIPLSSCPLNSDQCIDHLFPCHPL